MNLEEKELERNYIYNGRIINLRCDTALLPNNEKCKREIVEHMGGVAVIAISKQKDIFLVRQFRYPYKSVISEIPAGKRNSADEDPLLCGQRELKEETGITAKNYFSLGTVYPTPGYCEEIIHLFATTDLTFGESNPDDDEFLNVEKVPLDLAVKRVISGEIKDAKTQIAVLKLKLLLDSGKIEL